jgi:hypothetical protein
MSDIDNIIAAMYPEKYCDTKPSEISKIKRIFRDKGLTAAVEYIEEAKISAKAAEDFKLIYDSTSETLEPVYFWILDYMPKNYKKIDKLVDNFASSPGSGHFSELQGKATQMQQEASRVLGTVNNILKGVINLIYDLKEFKVRLSHYEAAESKNNETKEAGILSLKQIWMDKVDMLRGQGSINALSSGNLQFVTLRDGFMIVNSVKDVDKLDLNDRVKRILKPRVQEFFEWKTRSYQELKKRYEIEKIYLKGQVDALKLNAKWARPYLRTAQRLTANEGLLGDPGLVTAFNTILLQLTLFGASPINVKDSVMEKSLPRDFAKIKNLKKYNAIGVIDFTFRGIPSKMGQHYTFGGRVEITFKGYALTDDEIELLKEELKKSDMELALSLVEGMTTDSLERIQVDIDDILTDKKEKGKDSDDLNPFSALFSIFKSEKTEEKKSKEKSDKEKYEKLQNALKKSENYAEKYLRNFATAEAMNKIFNIYDIYKKGHGMAAFPFPFPGDKETKTPVSRAEDFLGLKRYDRD